MNFHEVTYVSVSVLAGCGLVFPSPACCMIEGSLGEGPVTWHPYQGALKLQPQENRRRIAANAACAQQGRNTVLNSIAEVALLDLSRGNRCTSGTLESRKHSEITNRMKFRYPPSDRGALDKRKRLVINLASDLYGASIYPSRTTTPCTRFTMPLITRS